MAKNEIHARISPELMEQIRQWTDNWKFPTISRTVRRLLELGLKIVNDDLDLQKKNDSLVRLIEQELKVFFARCRDERDTEDGQLYWFWFESENKSSWRFDSDSPFNWCPTKRFESQEEAIRDCLRHKPSEISTNFKNTTTPNSLDEHTPDEVIDW